MGKDKPKDDKWYYSFLPHNMAGGSTSPLIPLFITEALAGTVAQVGLLSAISSLAAIPSHILWGNLSDAAKKRRAFVLIGFGGMALAMLMMAFSINFFQYLIANVVMGVLSTAAAPVGTVLILESFPKKEWAKRLGDFSRIGGLGWVLGLLIGTIWIAFFTGAGSSAVEMRALFLLAGSLSLVSVFLAYRWVPEPGELVDRSQISGALHRVPLFTVERARYMPQRVMHVLMISTKNMRVENFPSNLRRYYLYTLVTFTGFLTFYVGLPIFLKQYAGMTSAEVFVIYLASSVASALTYSVAGRWATQYGSKKLQVGAVAGRMAVFPSFFLVTLLGLSTTGLLVVFCALHALLGFFWANISVSGNHIVSNICKKECRAESTGMYGAMQGSAAVAGALIGGYVAQSLGYGVVFAIASAFLVVGLIVLSRIKTDQEADGAEAPAAS
ncbi:MAG: MFS transporter [Methanomassiliicoccus sp.]|nr:MFS transporter [Methanomassiliicoccus sp.]